VIRTSDIVITSHSFLVEMNIKAVNPIIPFEAVHASRGKVTRAEPISFLYEQGLVHHFGTFPELEDQMCEWVPGAEKSPDRVDALVWALSFRIWHLGTSQTIQGITTRSGMGFQKTLMGSMKTLFILVGDALITAMPGITCNGKI